MVSPAGLYLEVKRGLDNQGASLREELLPGVDRDRGPGRRVKTGIGGEWA